MSTRRRALVGATVDRTTNAALWLDKYIVGQQRDDTESRPRLVREVAGSIPEPTIYPACFARWRAALEQRGAVLREASVRGRMVIGLGEESVLETSVALHHTYGVPYIPGSALKGLAASFARQQLGPEWREGSSAYTTVFGTTAAAGYVTFFDALYVPGSGAAGRPLHADVITVHHPDYYQRGAAPPADWDSPNPVPFLSATGRYLLALAGPGEWVEATYQILGLALKEAGIGAKTSSGYGRLELAGAPAAPAAEGAATVSGQAPAPRAPRDPMEPEVEQVLELLRALPAAQIPGQIHSFYQRWKNLAASGSLKQRLARAIVQKVRQAGREKWAADRGWYQELLQSLGEGRQS